MVPLQMKYDYKLAMLTYEYQDQILEHQIQLQQQQQPTDAQVKHRTIPPYFHIPLLVFLRDKLARCVYDIELQLETAKYDLTGISRTNSL